MMNKKNNKGFSLVELIVVVAIMAVLVGVLAPAYLKYVENSRVNKDNSNVEEIRHAVELAMSEEAVYAEVATGWKVTFTDAATDFTITDSADATIAAANCDDLRKAIESSVGKTLDLSAKANAGKKAVITITITGESVKVTSAIN